MTILEQIQAELGDLSEAELVRLYEVMQEIRSHAKAQPISLMAKLRSVKISGPIDLAENVDDYLAKAHHDSANLP